MKKNKSKKLFHSEHSGNLLIAEFMELESFEDGRYGKLWVNPVSDGVHQKTCFSLKYDIYFDWLMPVARKFKNLDLDMNEYRSRIEKIDGSIIDEYDIKQFFMTMVDAIKWYNKKIKTK